MLPKVAVTMTTSALAYTAIVRGLRDKACDLKMKFINTNGPLDVSQSLLLFPCCVQYVKTVHNGCSYFTTDCSLLRDAWHWILVAVYQSKEM